MFDWVRKRLCIVKYRAVYFQKTEAAIHRCSIKRCSERKNISRWFRIQIISEFLFKRLLSEMAIFATRTKDKKKMFELFVKSRSSIGEKWSKCKGFLKFIQNSKEGLLFWIHRSVEEFIRKCFTEYLWWKGYKNNF